MGTDAAPVGYAGSTMLISSRISAIGIALGMSDEDGDVGIIYIFVHDYMIAMGGIAQIHKVVIILGIMACVRKDRTR